MSRPLRGAPAEPGPCGRPCTEVHAKRGSHGLRLICKALVDLRLQETDKSSVGISCTRGRSRTGPQGSDSRVQRGGGGGRACLQPWL